jgi:hypothetical protein
MIGSPGQYLSAGFQVTDPETMEEVKDDIRIAIWRIANRTKFLFCRN